MGFKQSITREDVFFYMDMVDSVLSPIFVPEMYKPKPYIKITKDKKSIDYIKFMTIYKQVRHFLTIKEMYILDRLYSLDNDSETLRNVGKSLNLSSGRVRQIGHKGREKDC